MRHTFWALGGAGLSPRFTLASFRCHCFWAVGMGTPKNVSLSMCVLWIEGVLKPSYYGRLQKSLQESARLCHHTWGGAHNKDFRILVSTRAIV